MSDSCPASVGTPSQWMGATQPFDAHVIVRDNLTTTRTRPSAADRSRLLIYTMIITIIIINNNNATASADNTAHVYHTCIAIQTIRPSSSPPPRGNRYLCASTPKYAYKILQHRMQTRVLYIPTCGIRLHAVYRYVFAPILYTNNTRI